MKRHNLSPFVDSVGHRPHGSCTQDATKR